jgi:hypothetical protein
MQRTSPGSGQSVYREAVWASAEHPDRASTPNRLFAVLGTCRGFLGQVEEGDCELRCPGGQLETGGLRRKKLRSGVNESR